MDYLDNELEQAQGDFTENPEGLGEVAPADGEDSPQIDGEEEVCEDVQEKPKRKSRKKKEDTAEQAGASGENLFAEVEFPAGELPFDGQEPDDPADEDGAEDGALPEDTTSADVEEPERRRRSARRSAVLDSSGNIINERADSGQHDLSVLTAARNARRILTASVDAIETDGEALPRVVFYMGTVKVMIPFSQMGFDLDPEEVSQREARLLIDSMLGAKIDFMVRGVDTEARIAAGSRRDAMLLRQRTILNARRTGDEAKYRINEGMRVTARIVHVSRNAVRVEVYGFESYVRIDSISNLWVNDIREVLQVGEERPVEILSLTRDELGRTTAMRVSMKAAEDAPQLVLREGNTYTGHISNFSATAYYVRVRGIPVEVRCPIKSNHTMEVMGPGDFVKFYVRGIHDGIPTGAILKVLKKKIVPGL